MRVLLLPKYDEVGPSSRYRTFKYTKFLKKDGIEFDVYPLLDNGYVQEMRKGKKNYFNIYKSYIKRISILLTNAKKYDVLFIEKELFPMVPAFIEKLLLKKHSYILDYDDAIFIRYQNNKIKKIICGDKIDKLAKDAKLLTVGNDWYVSAIKYGQKRYLPTVIDLDEYPINSTNYEESKTPVIVWIGSHSTVNYLNIVVPALQALAQEFDFVFRMIGCKIEIKGVNTEFIPWNEETEFFYLNTSHIGIMPLYQTLWEHGKCGFKLIQYMASNVIPVGTNISANSEIIINGQNGFVIENDEWYQTLKNLFENKSSWKNIAKQARKTVEEHYSYQVNYKKLLSYLNE